MVDGSPGCAVKDSFATLDLAPHGFDALFDATWFFLEPEPATDHGDLRWDVVVDAEGLAAWARAWSRDDDSDAPFDVALLEDPDVAFLAARRRSDIVAGAIANAGP